MEFSKGDESPRNSDDRLALLVAMRLCEHSNNNKGYDRNTYKVPAIYAGTFTGFSCIVIFIGMLFIVRFVLYCLKYTRGAAIFARKRTTSMLVLSIAYLTRQY